MRNTLYDVATESRVPTEKAPKGLDVPILSAGNYPPGVLAAELAVLAVELAVELAVPPQILLLGSVSRNQNLAYEQAIFSRLWLYGKVFSHDP